MTKQVKPVANEKPATSQKKKIEQPAVGDLVNVHIPERKKVFLGTVADVQDDTLHIAVYDWENGHMWFSHHTDHKDNAKNNERFWDYIKE